MVCGFAILKGSSLSHGLIAVLVTVDLATSLRTWSASFHRRSNARTWITWTNTPPPETPLPASSALIEATDLETLAPMAPLSLRVNVADHVLIRGASGVGKSTLLDALLGVGNAVVLEGQVARRVVRSALIRPDSPLRQGTIDDNLSLGRALDPPDLESMLRRVGLWPSRISSANDAVASDGRNFSDGERIRLLIAQALLNDVELLVLDDVASSLDTESRTRLRNLFDTQDSLTIIEATSDDPLAQPTITVDLEWAR
jgi:ABC-type transport system involved in cytochrome bd biosynthesis fused ATPase/permease subunit